MYIKRISLLVAIYGRGAFATLSASCEEGDVACDKCTPIGRNYIPSGTGEMWYSDCCDESETDNASPPVTTTKKYCYSYKLKGYPNNLNHNIAPSCYSEDSPAWESKGQCSTTTGNDPWTVLTVLAPAGCPPEWVSGGSYESGDVVTVDSIEGTVFTCNGSPSYCRLYEPELITASMTVWKATNSCTGTITPTMSPVFSNAQDGCPEEYDSNTVYEPSDKVSVTLDDGRIKVYSCKSIPYGLHCKDPTYMPGPGGLAGSDGKTPLWETAWIYFGGCTGTYNPTMAPVFAPGSGGCPEEYDDGTNYESGDEVTVIGAGETYGKIYKCKGWPESDYCKQAEYAPVPGGRAGSDGITPLWKEAWMYVGGCTGTITPTAAPVFAPGSTGGCPEEFDGSTDYVGDDEVAVIGVGETWGKIYKCKGWPHVDRCNQAGYEPGLPGPNGESLWKEAWMYVGGCTGTITPTAAPVFAPGSTGGCPEEFDGSTDYVGDDEVAVIGVGETWGKIYKCKGWPHVDRCNQAGYEPGLPGPNGESLWKIAWEYVGGCTGTITPTAAPVFISSDWEKDGCPEEYEPNNASYEAGDYVSVPKNAENTRGIVYQCKSGNTSPWCQQENYAPYTEIGSAAWKRVGVCTGTISPTTAPTPLSANTPLNQLCQFKYPLSSTPTLETSTNKEYVVLQAGSWQSNAQIDTVTGGESLLLNRAGNLVRCGRDARQCTSGYPYSAWCPNNSPFEPSSQCENSNSGTYNWYHSPLGWKQSTCVDVVSKAADGNVEADGVDDLFGVGAAGPVFASNGDMLVSSLGACVNLAINSGDYFKPASTVKGCQKCLEYDSSTAITGEGFGSPANKDTCITCEAGTKSAIVDGKSQCVCDNGSTDPWDALGFQCQNCPGEKYLGAVDNSAGVGVCEPACPTGHSFYTTLTNSGNAEFKLCCKYSDCLNQAGTTGTVADCYDGTVGGAACTAAGLT